MTQADRQFYTVPAGKRLVIEYASLDGCILPGQSVELSISTSVGSTFVRHAVNNSNTGIASFSFSLSGYLVDVPLTL